MIRLLPARILLPLTAALTYGTTLTNAFTTLNCNCLTVQQLSIQTAFSATAVTERRRSLLYYNKDNDESEGFDLETLEERIGTLRLKIIEDDLLRPPSANMSPKEFVEAVLEGIFYNEDPRPDAGFMLLLRCSTDKWASTVLRSIGAPKNAELDAVASALGAAMARPHNQFAILTGDDDDDSSSSDKNSNSEERNFFVHFPGEILDFLDGTAWVNVEFRDKHDKSLMVLTGWQLSQRPDGAWLIDQIDWHDYREKYRPGIGREEWQGTYEGRRR